jgi:hypothetical protein
MPLVNYDAMYQARVRDAKGGFNQIAYWSRPSDWKNQTLPPNGEVLYMLVFVNTKEVGLVVVDIPPAGDAVLFGTVIGSWQVPIEDVGPAGVDAGKGGKYLVLPPDYTGYVPVGCVPLRSRTYQSYAPLRTIPKSWDAADLAKSVAYLKQVKVYPLPQAASPPRPRFIDVADTVFDSAISYDLRFFQALDRMVQVEPLQTKDKVMTDLLKSIGIEKGKPFNPDPKTAEILAAAAQEAHAWCEDRWLSVLSPYYPSRQ